MDFRLRLERAQNRQPLDQEMGTRIHFEECEILRTMNIYCHAMDYGLPDVWAQCFTEDGVYQVKLPGGGKREIIGRTALAAYASTHEGPPQKYTKHMFWAPVVEFASDVSTASASAMFAIVNSTPHGPRVELYGSYDDNLVKGADGVWRFEKRITTVESDAAPATIGQVSS